MQKPLYKSRIIPIKINRVTPYHYVDTSVDPKAKSNSDDRFFSGLAIPLVIPLCLLISTKNRSSELDFAFGSIEVLKQ